MLESNLELKGSSFTLSVLHLKSSDLQLLSRELDNKLNQAPQFFLGAPLVLNFSLIDNDNFDLIALRDILSNKKLVIVGITGAAQSINQQAKSIGLAIMKSGKSVNCPPPPARTTMLVKKTVRSGQQIYAKNADLIVIGAVSNGAEVIADGNIHIYGALRGKAMAGASGDEHSIIIAKKTEAELVSIAGQYWLTESLQEHCDGLSACIRLKNKSLIIESLAL
ncbi:septum site-determining protein MinC [Parashewanella spongiae]|uniref:Probable septum site-determining protein MinC n=1 Tax=Parashewanella spongiae TaxID=342950 RepID=A0A3A6U070_9GAMM|nr:septum site-determining protein MinC [Parashewanella spongiae]MCL1077236.1 septum site-determining protein MinC [Parashewanella spongiae]RJY18685.1 septum site-determining protein MinC [Parashewanella spongiae]